VTWNYRVIQHKDFVGIHEVYYDIEDTPMHTRALVVGDDLEDLRALDKPFFDPGAQ
jgi:hypothetical protein